MYLGNVMLLILNLPLIGIWVKVLRIPYHILFPLIILFCLVSSYSLNNNIGDVTIMIFFGVVGYLMKKFGYEGAPLILALVLGPMLEESLRHSFIISHGSFAIFFASPISAALMGLALVLLILPLITHKRPVPELQE